MSTVLERLRTLRRAGTLEPMCVAFAEWVHRRDGRGGTTGDDAGAVALAAALLAAAVEGGDVAIDLSTSAGRAPWPDDAPDLRAPALDAWLAALSSSPAVVADEDVPAEPMVLLGSRLSLARYVTYERRLAGELADRARALDADGGDERTEAALGAVFGADEPRGPGTQRAAAETAATGRFTVISGGPGTGKTTTVLRFLAVLCGRAGEAERPPRIRLAAPTGKAAARLAASIAEGRERLVHQGNVPAAWIEAVPRRAMTLHRLLGLRPGGDAPRYRRGRPLPADVVVVDEASMVDLALMTRLVDALPGTARLILLGDRDQLASVEAGAVLGDLCAAADEPASPLAGRIVHLTRSWRFRPDGGIGRLAAAVRGGDVEEAIAALAPATVDPELRWLADEDPADALDARIAEGYEGYVRAVTASSCEPERALEAFERFRVLCAVRSGPRGVAGVNARAERVFADALDVPRRGGSYPGRPVLVTRNEPSVGLFNGDVGVTVRDVDNGRLRVAFRDEGDGIRLLSPGRLPEHDTCWAMTVHKSQGSEFDAVVVVLPEAGAHGPSPVATRELLYTGVTRARLRADVVATRVALEAAIRTPTMRRGDLARRLGARGGRV